MPAKDGVRLNDNYILILGSHTKSNSWSDNIILSVADNVLANQAKFINHLSVIVCKGNWSADFQDFLFMRYSVQLLEILILIIIILVLIVLLSLLIRKNRIRVLCKMKAAKRKLKDTNDKFAMVLCVANILSWKWDIKTKTIYCDLNRKRCYEESEDNEIGEAYQLTEEQYYSLIVDEDRDLVRQAYESIKNGSAKEINLQYRVKCFNGEFKEEYWVEAHATVVTCDKNGNPCTLIGALLNITERKKMEMALVQAKERAEESNRLKSAFLANISHEIRTPLNAIVGFSTILLSTVDEEEKREYMDIIEKNNELLLQLINDIIDLSKIEAGTLDFDYSNVCVNELMGKLKQIIAPKINPNRVKLIFEPSEPECYLYTDRSRVAQIMLNMLMNAAKFTAEGSIRLGYERQENVLCFYVADTGCGIPYEQQQTVFNRFIKLDEFSQGIGLGLSICQVIAQQMGGEIGVKSEVGVGSTFWFTLPLP